MGLGLKGFETKESKSQGPGEVKREGVSWSRLQRGIILALKKIPGGSRFCLYYTSLRSILPRQLE